MEKIVEVLALRIIAKDISRRISNSGSAKELRKSNYAVNKILNGIMRGEENISISELKQQLIRKQDCKAQYKIQNRELLVKRREINRRREALLDELTAENEPEVQEKVTSIRESLNLP